MVPEAMACDMGSPAGVRRLLQGSGARRGFTWLHVGCAAALLIGCGGSVSDPSSCPASSAPSAAPVFEVVETDFESITVTGPGEAVDLSIACEAPRRFLSGSCTYDEGAALVESQPTGVGWMCGFTSRVDGALVSVSVHCAVPAVSDGGDASPHP